MAKRPENRSCRVVEHDISCSRFRFQFPINQGGANSIHRIDGRDTGIHVSSVEVLPGPRIFTVRASKSNSIGRVFFADRIIEITAEAGHRYRIEVEPYMYRDEHRWGDSGFFVWAVNESTGTKVAGIKPPAPGRPPDNLPCDAPFEFAVTVTEFIPIDFRQPSLQMQSPLPKNSGRVRRRHSGRISGSSA